MLEGSRTHASNQFILSKASPEFTTQVTHPTARPSHFDVGSWVSHKPSCILEHPRLSGGKLQNTFADMMAMIAGAFFFQHSGVCPIQWERFNSSSNNISWKFPIKRLAQSLEFDAENHDSPGQSPQSSIRQETHRIRIAPQSCTTVRFLQPGSPSEL